MIKSKKNTFGALLSGLLLLLATGIAVAADERSTGGQGAGIESTLSAIKSKAAKVDSASGGEKAVAQKALLDAVSQAIAGARDADEVSRIIAAAVTAAPSQAEAVTSTAVKAAPAQAATIVKAAVNAAPSKAVAITVAALGATPNRNQAPTIINSAMRVAPRDGKTVADLQSLATRNWTPQNNTQQNFSQVQQKFDNQNQQNNNPSPPPVEKVMGGGASPS